MAECGRTVLLLTTTGRRSGHPRTTPLLYLPDGENLVVVNSDVEPPDWWRNLPLLSVSRVTRCAAAGCDLRMGRFVAFLRAVNVGPRRVAMATARRVLVDLGYQDVASYVNSANLLFSSLGKTEDLTFVRTAKEVQTLVVDKPFSLAGQDAHFVLLPLKRMSPNEQTAVLNMAN